MNKQNLFDLNGKVAIVTGSSRGLGQAMAIALASAGAHIVGVSSSDSESTRESVEALGRKYLKVEFDLSSCNRFDGLVADIFAWMGHVDIVVNNAGLIRRDDAINFSQQDWDDTLNLNLRSVFMLTQSIANRWIANESSGKVINIASMLSYQGGIRVPAYTASKSGLMGLTKALANEWASKNINVNAIAPGYMATDNTAALRSDEHRNKEILGRIPCQRWGVAEDLAGAIIFLSSQASNYVTGHTLAVDGGWLAR